MENNFIHWIKFICNYAFYLLRIKKSYQGQENLWYGGAVIKLLLNFIASNVRRGENTIEIVGLSKRNCSNIYRDCFCRF